MTQIGRFIPADGEPGESRVHSVDHFSLNGAEADSFGMDVECRCGPQGASHRRKKHAWAVIAEGAAQEPALPFLWGLRGRVSAISRETRSQGNRRLDPPPEHESNGLRFRDHNQNVIEIQVCEHRQMEHRAMAVQSAVPCAQCRNLESEVERRQRIHAVKAGMFLASAEPAHSIEYNRLRTAEAKARLDTDKVLLQLAQQQRDHGEVK